MKHILVNRINQPRNGKEIDSSSHRALDTGLRYGPKPANRAPSAHRTSPNFARASALLARAVAAVGLWVDDGKGWKICK